MFVTIFLLIVTPLAKSFTPALPRAELHSTVERGKPTHRFEFSVSSVHCTASQTVPPVFSDFYFSASSPIFLYTQFIVPSPNTKHPRSLPFANFFGTYRDLNIFSFFVHAQGGSTHPLGGSTRIFTRYRWLMGFLRNSSGQCTQ